MSRLDHLPDLQKDSPFSYSWTKPVEVLPAYIHKNETVYANILSAQGRKISSSMHMNYLFISQGLRHEITGENIPQWHK